MKSKTITLKIRYDNPSEWSRIIQEVKRCVQSDMPTYKTDKFEYIVSDNKIHEMFSSEIIPEFETVEIPHRIEMHNGQMRMIIESRLNFMT